MKNRREEVSEAVSQSRIDREDALNLLKDAVAIHTNAKDDLKSQTEELAEAYDLEKETEVLLTVQNMMLGSGEFAGMYFYLKYSGDESAPKWGTNSRYINMLDNYRTEIGLTRFGLLYRSRALLLATALSKSPNINPARIKKVYAAIEPWLVDGNSSETMWANKFFNDSNFSKADRIDTELLEKGVLFEAEIELGQSIIE